MLSYLSIYAYEDYKLTLANGEMPRKPKCVMLRPLRNKANAYPTVFSTFRPVFNLKYVSTLIEKEGRA